MSEPWRTVLARRLYVLLGVVLTAVGALLLVACVGTLIMLGPSAFELKLVASQPAADAMFLLLFALLGGLIAVGGVSMWDGPRRHRSSERPDSPASRRRH